MLSSFIGTVEYEGWQTACGYITAAGRGKTVCFYTKISKQLRGLICVCLWWLKTNKEQLAQIMEAPPPPSPPPPISCCCEGRECVLCTLQTPSLV